MKLDTMHEGTALEGRAPSWPCENLPKQHGTAAQPPARGMARTAPQLALVAKAV